MLQYPDYVLLVTVSDTGLTASLIHFWFNVAQIMSQSIFLESALWTEL